MPQKIYCNLCFETQAETRRKHFITSCSHVICESCLTQKNFCGLCAKDCKALEINADLPTEVRAFFEDGSIPKMNNLVTKIQNFRENQAKMFAEKTIRYSDEYKLKYSKYLKCDPVVNELKVCEQGERELVSLMKTAYNSCSFKPELLRETPRGPNFRRSISQASSSHSPASSHTGSNSHHSPSSRMSHASSASGRQSVLSNDMKRAIEFRTYPSSGSGHQMTSNSIKPRSSSSGYSSLIGNNQPPGTFKSFSPSVSNYSSEKPTNIPAALQMYQEGSSKTLMKDLLIKMQQANLAKVKALTGQIRK